MRATAMRRNAIVATFSAASFAAAIVFGLMRFTAGQEQVPSPVPSGAPAAPAAGHYMGVGSCASPACHGGPDTAENIRQRGKWNSSYTVWVEKDKHAKAYSVLYSPESRKILRSLDHLDAKADARPYLDERCLACHSTMCATPHESRAFPADGIGCEACHGPARAWITGHTKSTWDKSDPRMVNTRDMAVRASVCVDCHVGSAGADGMPVRNMNHDMIAAGHPRLTFELSAFLANMPRHWDDREETSRDDYAVHTWAVGQVASTQAALRLLSARAKAAEAPAEKAPWPELSEYDCFTCHHGLSLNGYRQKGESLPEPRKLGRYVWGTWYLPMTRLLANRGFGGFKSGLANLDRAARLLEDPAPDAGAVARAADAAGPELQLLLDEVKKARFDTKAVDRLLLATKELPAKDWDEACGEYLLFRTALSKDPRFTDGLAAVRALLQFPDEKQESGATIRYNSPVQFDPSKFNARMDELRKLLPR